MIRECLTCIYYKKAQGHLNGHAAGYKCYECTNIASDCYGAYLNIDESGNVTKEIWSGCDEWKKQEATA